MNKKFLLWLIPFFLSGCGFIIEPITWAIAHSIKPYTNTTYSVTDECAKDMLRSIAKYTGKGASSDEEFIKFKKIFNYKINQKFDIDWDIEELIKKKAFTMKNDKGSYYYLISNSSNKLELILVGLKIEQDSTIFGNEARLEGSKFNPVTGIESYVLDECLI